MSRYYEEILPERLPETLLSEGVSTAITVDIPLFLPLTSDQIFELIVQAFSAGLLSGFSMFFICWGANLALNIIRSS